MSDRWRCDYDKLELKTKTWCSNNNCRGGPYCVKYDANSLFENQDEAHGRFETAMGIHTDNEDAP